jgi:glycosyltransferase involved in cell wall biosynthesis
MNKQRVLVFTETALALSETFIADHCRSLSKYDYRLVALHGNHENHSDVPRYFLFDSKPSRVARLAFRLGHSQQLNMAIEQFKPDLIHAHYLTNGAFLLPYAKRHGIPLVTTAHGHDATRPIRWNSAYDQLYRLQRQRLIEHCDLVLPVSNYLRSKLVVAGFPPDRTRTHYLGIPLQDAPPVSIENNPPRIVFVGRLVAKKGIDMVLAAFAVVQRTRPDAELHIVGDGPLRALVEASASTIGNVTIHGAQQPARTREIMATARLLTLPSRPAVDGDIEGFGLVLIEAQALGTPVVTSNQGGTAEALIDGVTGLAVDPSNETELAAAFLTLLNKPEQARAMGVKAYAFVRENFDIERQTASLERIYDSLLEQKDLLRKTL